MGRRQRGVGEALVGRGHELQILDRSVDEVGGGGTAAVAVMGEPGIGKSRLLKELVDRAQAASYRVFTGCGSELEPEIPFGLVVEALDDEAATMDVTLRRRLGEERMAELGVMLPSLTDVRALPPSTLEVERFRGYSAIAALLEELGRQRPVLLAFDDAHWADPASAELVAYLLRHQVRRTLLALAFRPLAPTVLGAAVERASFEGSLRSLVLSPLTLDQSSQVLGDDVAPEVRDALYVESGGNPFYLQELVRAAPRRPAVHEVAVAVHTGQPLDLPSAVRVAVEQELDQLGAPARRLAHAAAIAGTPFDLDLAGEIGGLDPDEVALIDELLDADLVRPAEEARRFWFRHPIVRRAVYDAAGHAWRMRAHHRAAVALERRGASVAVRAQHVVLSGAAVGDEAAIAVLVEAAEVSMRRAPAAAAHWLGGALRLLPAATDAERRLSLLVPLATALLAVGRLGEARRVLADALALLPASDDGAFVRRQLTVMIARIDQGLGRGEEARMGLATALAGTETGSREAGELTLELAKNHVMMAEWDHAARAAATARVLALSLGDRALLVDATATAAFFQEWTAGSWSVRDTVSVQAIDDAAAGIDAIADDEISPQLLEALVYLVYAETNAERWDAAESHANRGVRICRTTGQGFRYLDFMRPLVAIRLWQGRLQEARHAADVVDEATNLLDNDQALTLGKALHCWLAALQGRTSESFAAGEEAVQAADRSPRSTFAWMAHVCYGLALVEAGQHRRGRARIHVAGGPELIEVPPGARPHWFRRLVEAELAAGLVDEAGTSADRAEALANAMALPMRIGDARYARAAVLLTQGDPARAAATARDAAAAYDTSGIRIEAARSRLLAAQALAAAGTEGPTVAHELELAHRVFDACGAVRLADRAASELRRLGYRIGRASPRGNPADGPASLSRREREVAGLAAQGYTNRQIAEELFVSRKTVETHLAHIFAKLGVSSRAAMATALQGQRQ